MGGVFKPPLENYNQKRAYVAVISSVGKMMVEPVTENFSKMILR